MQKIQLFISSAFVVALLLFVYANWRKSWNGKSRARSVRLPQAPAPLRNSQAGASVSLEIVGNLKKSNAQWPAILEQLNPTGAEPVKGLLMEIRGPHMFDPRTALLVIEEGLRSAMKESVSASTYEGLVAAKRSMEKVTRYGD